MEDPDFNPYFILQIAEGRADLSLQPLKPDSFHWDAVDQLTNPLPPTRAC